MRVGAAVRCRRGFVAIRLILRFTSYELFRDERYAVRLRLIAYVITPLADSEKRFDQELNSFASR